MTLIANIRSSLYAKHIRQRSQIYSGQFTEAERLSRQLELWNVEWERIRVNVPYYQRLVQNSQLPARFQSWKEFQNIVPITTRSMVQKNVQSMTSSERAPDMVRKTGGSTSEPIQMPGWRSEKEVTRYDMWLGYSWYGVTPASRSFRLWGHSHLLGTGIRGWINARKREISDYMLGYYRFSAYDLQSAVLRLAAENLIQFQPEYIIGYSVALDRFARTNWDLQAELSRLPVKVVIGTAENFPALDSVSSLERLFSAPVSMEYGAVETGVIAHMRPSGHYQVFWQTYLVEAEKRSHSSGGWTIRVTSLYPRAFPLIRYEIGDEIELMESDEENIIGVEKFSRVIGRCNDYIVLTDGATIHSEVFTHAVRACSDITGYQVVQTNGRIEIRYLASAPLTSEQKSGIRVRLERVHLELKDVEIVRVASLKQTIAGKTKMVLVDETG